MTIVEGTTYDIFAEDGAGWIIDDRRCLTDMLAVKIYAEFFKKMYDPYAIYVTEHKTYLFANTDAKPNTGKENL